MWALAPDHSGFSEWNWPRSWEKSQSWHLQRKGEGFSQAPKQGGGGEGSTSELPEDKGAWLTRKGLSITAEIWGRTPWNSMRSRSELWVLRHPCETPWGTSPSHCQWLALKPGQEGKELLTLQGTACQLEGLVCASWIHAQVWIWSTNETSSSKNYWLKVADLWRPAGLIGKLTLC